MDVVVKTEVVVTIMSPEEYRAMRYAILQVANKPMSEMAEDNTVVWSLWRKCQSLKQDMIDQNVRI